ncbi:hypothetical protein NDU88_003696 [Pleurodeles waltl]|uniref:Uncharacterized protein n=1 Tax=Pleurodeles waltl TaxID=8319 RepID=A0AAV7W2W7_PLEWA|nr:hypothetical protein NDU88_003696 [Pleurodeles waltl]
MLRRKGSASSLLSLSFLLLCSCSRIKGDKSGCGAAKSPRAERYRAGCSANYKEPALCLLFAREARNSAVDASSYGGAVPCSRFQEGKVATSYEELALCEVRNRKKPRRGWCKLWEAVPCSRSHFQVESRRKPKDTTQPRAAQATRSLLLLPESESDAPALGSPWNSGNAGKDTEK